MRYARLLSIGTICLLGASCGSDGVTVDEMPPEDSSDVVFQVDPEDGALGTLLGWSGGIPGAEIVIMQEDTSGTPWRITGRTDAIGRLPVSNMPAGRYTISISRLLTDQERARSTGTGVTGLLLRTVFVFDSRPGTVRLLVPSSERGSLLISEFEFYVTTQTGQSYVPGGYIELYNNSDTTIYLDGKLIARGYEVFQGTSARPCSSTEPFRANPAGLWAAAFERFPGSGRDFPLGSGQSVVVAVDAIDHRPFALNAYDLSKADFEFRGSGDADNPQVPNMVNVGLREGTQYGLAWPAGVMVGFVSDAVDVTSLPRAREAGFPTEYALFPAARILDAIAFWDLSPEVPLCVPFMDPRFVRDLGVWSLGKPNGVSLQRKPLIRLPNGKLVIQSTRSSANDWYAQASTPGSTPPF